MGLVFPIDIVVDVFVAVAVDVVVVVVAVVGGVVIVLELANESVNRKNTATLNITNC